MRQYSFMTRLKFFTFVFGITVAFASCANDDLAQNETTSTEDKGLTAFSTGAPTTRTSMKEDGTFYWEAGDYIFVKDDNNMWRKSRNTPKGKTASFKFMVPGTYTAHNSYDVYYPGKNGTNDQVTISAAQTQTEPNTTAHFGASGDCGMASASRIGTNNQFNFTLDHKAAYLRFLPRTENTILHDCYLTKVEVTADDNIAAVYTLDMGTGKLIGTGTGNTIILTTKAKSGTYANGFPLTNTGTSATDNGSYMVIKPGTHSLRVRYWIKDYVSNVEGTITKILVSKTFDQNKFYDITAKLDVKDYDGDHYYMWDAQEQYWKGHEWWSASKDQPVLTAHPNMNYPQNSSDPRFYNQAFIHNVHVPATHSCKDSPNANELSWYCMYGDPHWDDELWTTMGHLHKGGLWLKKKSVLQAESHYDTEKSADGTTDLRTTEKHYKNVISTQPTGLPSVANANKYFFLPASGEYDRWSLTSINIAGCWWSSTGHPGASYYGYGIIFDRNSVDVDGYFRNFGLRVQPFSDFGDN